MYRQQKTVRGYALDEVVSAIQKAIRRNNFKVAGYFALELYASGFCEYVWKRLLVISAEDVYQAVTGEINALYEAWARMIKKYPRMKNGEARVFVAKAVLLLAESAKCRDAQILIGQVYRDKLLIKDKVIERFLKTADKVDMEMPEFALCMHTARGRARGDHKEAFIKREFEALTPRVAGYLTREFEEQILGVPKTKRK